MEQLNAGGDVLIAGDGRLQPYGVFAGSAGTKEIVGIGRRKVKEQTT
jgi:hypothetical protein